MVIRVDAELSIEAIDTMVAATNPATTKPTRPAGRSCRIKFGYTRSGRANFGNSSNAQIPANTARP